ncbi:M48 family metalloprotease [Ramlibacter rhizophilus]|uniref:Peptidase M48 n=1 Tax=Ramlibacter rhizophilus TaxID=1781167 RepID=A0A4Z0BEW9_9BURK|nr:M48 family metalloprotease [Ramlibacter rhizophilus]TFY97895.1 peptidase M48 [Ramlibacter rhizophilus]
MKDSMIRGRRPGLAALVLALSVAFTPAGPASAQLPSLGDSSDISASTERRIGDRIARELYRDPDYIDDPLLHEYVMSLWQPLLAAARQRGDLNTELDQRFAWQVLLGKDRSINAFALPGGWLGLHLGLVASSGSRDELAAVLAHELSHVTQRHIARLMSREKRQTPWMIGAMILGALAAAKSPEAGKAVMTGGQALAVQNQLNFSREMEREADRVGLGIMSQAGFQPQGFAGMFEKLQQQSRLNDDGAYPYLRTHPLTTERLADMQSRQVLGGRSAAPVDWEHAMMAARARALSAGGTEALRNVLREASSTPADAGDLRQAGVLYAGALAASKLGDHATALRLVDQLGAKVQQQPAAMRASRVLAGEIALAANDRQRIAPWVDEATGSGRPEVLLSARAALRAGQPAQAAQKLQTWVALHPQDGTAWQLLATAHAAQGQPARAVRAEAEAQVAWMDYAAAMDRLRAAQDLARRGSGSDHIEASIIDTRVRQVESLLREQALER